MRRTRRLLVLVLAILVLLASALAVDLPGWRANLIDDPQNVIASELVGTWEYSKPLSESLGGAAPFLASESVTFRKVKAAEQRIVNHLDEIVRAISLKVVYNQQEQEKARVLSTIYLAGEVEFQGKQRNLVWDFALVSHHGNPCIVYYDRQQDLESTIVMLARDLKGDNDLLFIGGDFNNQSFCAYKRKAQP